MYREVEISEASGLRCLSSIESRLGEEVLESLVIRVYVEGYSSQHWSPPIDRHHNTPEFLVVDLPIALWLSKGRRVVFHRLPGIAMLLFEYPSDCLIGCVGFESYSESAIELLKEWCCCNHSL